jgi:hypothetical protein
VNARSRWAAVLVSCGLVLGAASAGTAAGTVTLRDPSTGFRVTAPKGFTLQLAGGGYTITGGTLTVTTRVITTARGARAFGESLRPAGDAVALRRGNAARFRLLTVGKAVRTNIVVFRRGKNLVVSTGVFPRGRAGLAGLAGRIAASVRGGKPGAGTSPGTTAPARASARLLPLIPYRAPDGGATAWVPSDPDWVVSSTGGALEGSGPRGSFLLGQTFKIFLPGVAPPGSLPSTAVEYPFVSAIDALTQVWPLINQGVGINMTNVQVRALIGDATIPSYRSSGMLVFDFQVNGRPFTGVANIATEDRLSAYSNFFWQMYISVIAVPDDGDPTVGAGLRLVWRSWNPGGAIAQRSDQARQILNEINETWKGVAEFRSRTADQQSRDVSCLLRTGPFIDDHARELGLPPLLDCDSTYFRTTP